MTRYDGTIRVHVTGSSDREQVPEVTIEDMNDQAWRATTVRGAIPVTQGQEPIDVLIELMDGDRAGWTARATARVEDDQIVVEGTEAFMP